MKIRGTFYNILKTSTLYLGCVKRSRMGWREFILIVLVENKIVCHKGIRI